MRCMNERVDTRLVFLDNETLVQKIHMAQRKIAEIKKSIESEEKTSKTREE